MLSIKLQCVHWLVVEIRMLLVNILGRWETLGVGFVLLWTRQQSLYAVLIEVVFPIGFRSTLPSFTV